MIASRKAATFRRFNMRTLLEKAIVHLLNGDENKAAALFHKFMVERARQIHESLRQNDGSDENLDENWDSEIQEEEYFGDDDLGDGASDPAMGGAPPDDGSGGGFGGGDDAAPMDAVGSDDGMGGDGMADDGLGDDDGMGGDDDGLGGDDMGDGSEPGIEGKIDDLTDKIDQLTAEFDRVMSEFHDEDDGDEFGGGDTDGTDGLDDPDSDGDGLADTDGDGDGFGGGDEASSDFGGEDSPEGGPELAGRMEDDMTDDHPEHEPVAEGELPDFLKKKNATKKNKEETDEDDDSAGDDDLSDITESVLAELEKVATPSNTEHKGVGSSSVKNNITTGPKDSPLPHHNVMDRVKGEPVMTKGPTHKGYAKEESPPVKSADTLVKNVRPENRRKSFKDTMATVSDKGNAALIKKDFAPGMPKPTKSIIDGKTSKG
jgi:hypothetical protein